MSFYQTYRLLTDVGLFHRLPHLHFRNVHLYTSSHVNTVDTCVCVVRLEHLHSCCSLLSNQHSTLILIDKHLTLLVNHTLVRLSLWSQVVTRRRTVQWTPAVLGYEKFVHTSENCCNKLNLFRTIPCNHSISPVFTVGNFLTIVDFWMLRSLMFVETDESEFCPERCVVLVCGTSCFTDVEPVFSTVLVTVFLVTVVFWILVTFLPP